MLLRSTAFKPWHSFIGWRCKCSKSFRVQPVPRRTLHAVAPARKGKREGKASVYRLPAVWKNMTLSTQRMHVLIPPLWSQLNTTLPCSSPQPLIIPPSHLSPPLPPRFSSFLSVSEWFAGYIFHPSPHYSVSGHFNGVSALDRCRLRSLSSTDSVEEKVRPPIDPSLTSLTPLFPHY